MIKIHVIASSMHSGRLLLVHEPVAPALCTASTANIANSALTQRMVVDVREKREVIYTIPYVNYVP